MTLHALDQAISYSTEAEATVLGAVMNNNDILDTLGFLKPEHFYGAGHQKIYAVCRELYDQGKLANPITMRVMADSDPDIGGVRVLVECVKRSSLHNAVQLGRYVKDLYARRELIKAFTEATESLHDESVELTNITTKISDLCDSVSAGERIWEMRNGEEVAQSIIDGFKIEQKPFSTGIKRLDKAMDGGIYPGKMYGFAGKKKHGKTILGGTISCNMACAGVKHLFICGEMSPEEIHQRNLARMGEFYPSGFRTGYSKSDDFKEKFALSMKWAQKNILYRNAPGMTFDQLKQMVKRAIIYHGIKGFVLDYLQLVGGKDPRKSMAEHQDEVSQWIADTCRKYGVFSIVLAQINQEGNTRGGEGLRLACDQAYAIQRPKIDEPGMWLEMLDTRYTPWANVGSKDVCSLILEPLGVYFKEVE